MNPFSGWSGFAIFCLSLGICHAEPVPLYLMEVPPMTMNEAERKGIVGDIALEALRRAGVQTRLIVEPSNRAMRSVKQSDDALIIPLARLRDREADYTWIAPIVKVNRAFFTLNSPANSFADASQKYRSIAVSRGTAGVSILLDNGFSHEQIIEVKQGDIAPKMLLAGRIDAWFNLVSESRLLLQEADPDKKIKTGNFLGSTYNYIACSRICNTQTVNRLRATINSMEKDGSIAAIKARYGVIE